LHVASFIAAFYLYIALFSGAQYKITGWEVTSRTFCETRTYKLGQGFPTWGTFAYLKGYI